MTTKKPLGPLSKGGVSHIDPPKGASISKMAPPPPPPPAPPSATAASPASPTPTNADSTERLAMLMRLVEVASPHVQEIRGRHYPIVDFVALTDLVLAECASARIDELNHVQLEHGRYVTQTFVAGQAVTIEERIADLRGDDE